jgi:thiamine biosynthesis protein ThiS
VSIYQYYKYGIIDIMKITLNGEEIVLDRQINVSDLLEKYSLDRRKIAVERNMEIVPQSSFEEIEISDGDNIEIIHFIGGG